MSSPPSQGVSDPKGILRLTETYVQDYMSKYKDCSHDWSHVQRVRSLALHLARSENALGAESVNEQLVELAALLHDVGDFKFLAPGETPEGILDTFMMKAEYPRDIQEAILWILPRISFRHELKDPVSCQKGPYVRELACVQDADRLEAIGAIGIARCFAYNGIRGMPLYNAHILPRLELDADHYDKTTRENDGNARNHFYEKLLKLASLMKTRAGREEAQRRHAFLKEFIAEFDRECGLDSSLLAHF